jgi:hypothetical protein
MGHKQYCAVSGILFLLVALAHLIRIVYSLPVLIDTFSVPVFVSWVGFVVPAGLSLWAFRIVRGRA